MENFDFIKYNIELEVNNLPNLLNRVDLNPRIFVFRIKTHLRNRCVLKDLKQLARAEPQLRIVKSIINVLAKQVNIKY